MLQSISVKNFAIIENIEVEFKSGMTALTGETGAGKSLLIDAIGLLLGDRATSNIVRTGSQKAEVEGIFFYQHPNIKKLLVEYDLDSGSNELIIKRQVTPSNNNIIKINNKTVTLQQLREVTNLLADIHTQYDTHRLINQETYIDIIDGFQQEETEKLLTEYHQYLAAYKKELKELHRLQKSKDDLLERYDLLTFQIKELEGYDLDLTEEETIKEEISKMENFDKIYQTIQETLSLFDYQNAIDRIYDAAKQIEQIESYNSLYGQLKERDYSAN